MVLENKGMAKHYAHKIEQYPANCAEILELDENEI